MVWLAILLYRCAVIRNGADFTCRVKGPLALFNYARSIHVMRHRVVVNAKSSECA